MDDQATTLPVGGDAPGTTDATARPQAGAASTGVPTPGGDADWPAKAADLVEAVVGGVHDRVVRPLVLVARGVVFGIVAGAMALVLTVLVAVAVIRLLDVYLFGHQVWASDTVVGGVFTIVGILLWSKRHAAETA